MATVSLSIGGRRYDVNCRDGEEDHLHHLGRVIDSKIGQARQSSAGINEVRQLLFAAILLADELGEAQNKLHRAQERIAETVAPPVPDAETMTARLKALTGRIENIARKLAEEGATS